MKCPDCGKEITDSSQYCKYCGTKIEKPKIMFTICIGIITR